MVLCLAAREVRHGHTRSFRNSRVLWPCLDASTFKNLDFENLVGSSSFCLVSYASFYWFLKNQEAVDTQLLSVSRDQRTINHV